MKTIITSKSHTRNIDWASIGQSETIKEIQWSHDQVRRGWFSQLNEVIHFYPIPCHRGDGCSYSGCHGVAFLTSDLVTRPSSVTTQSSTKVSIDARGNATRSKNGEQYKLCNNLKRKQVLNNCNSNFFAIYHTQEKISPRNAATPNPKKAVYKVANCRRSFDLSSPNEIYQICIGDLVQGMSPRWILYQVVNKFEFTVLEKRGKFWLFWLQISTSHAFSFTHNGKWTFIF